MKYSKMIASIGTMLLFTFLLMACGGEKDVDQTTNEPGAETQTGQVPDPTAEPTPPMEPTPTAEPIPTVEPTPTAEIEPEKIDLGYDAWLLVRGLADDVTLDVNIDPAYKDDLPDTMNYDYVHSEIALVHLAQNNEPATVDSGVVELCYKTTLLKGPEEDPVPYYWDTSQTTLVERGAIRVSTREKEPDLVVCMMVDKSGAYGLIAR